MKEHSYFSDLSDDDLIEFSNDSLIKLGKLRKALKQVFIGEIENFVKAALKSQAIKTYTATQVYYPDGTTKVHQNNWFSHGIACKLLKLGNKSWRQGKIRIRVEIKFEPDEKKTANTDFSKFIEVDTDDISNMINLLNDADDVDDELEILRRQLEGL